MPDAMAAPIRGTAVVWRVLAAVASLAAGVLFALGVTRVVLDGFEPWGASFVGSVGVWSLLLGRYALAGWRPEIRGRMLAGLLGAKVGVVVGVLVTAPIAWVLAPGSETAPVLVAIHAVPVVSTLGLLAGWSIAALRGRSKGMAAG